MAKTNKKKGSRNDAHTELKTLESKWLKDRRMDSLEPIQIKVMAAKVAAVVDYAEQNEMPVNFGDWPLSGAEELVKIDESHFKLGLSNLQKVGVLNSGYKFRKVANEEELRETLAIASADGLLYYRCAKPGGVNLSDRDEYILEDQEVCYSEEAIAESSSLQTAIANEWLVQVEKQQEA